MNYQDSVTAWRQDAALLAEKGVIVSDAQLYLPDEFRTNFDMAMDAQPQLITSPSAAIPVFLTTMIDPEVFRILFTPNKAATILGERKKGTWLDQTAMFPVVESVGEVTSYGDFNENGHTGVNMGWPQRQNYLFQTIEEYGELELERAGLARLNYVAELDRSAATVMDRFLNYSYFFGIGGLQNYGMLNDPNLGATLAPATKAAGGVKWITAGGAINATANEIYADIQALFIQLVAQSGGLVQFDTKMVLAMSPASHAALTTTNSFGVSVMDLLQKNFPNIRIEIAVQYGALSSANPQGVAAGNFIQLIATQIEGQDYGYAAFSEKMRAHPVIRAMSSFKKKLSGGTWGSVIRMPMLVASMTGM
jgi:hypothetical protein